MKHSKIKKLIGMLLTVAMLLSMIPGLPVYASVAIDWQVLGGTALSSQATEFTSLSVYDGVTYTAFSTYWGGNKKTGVYSYDENRNWQIVGSFLDEARYGTLCADNGILYFAYVTPHQDVEVVKYDLNDPAGDWVELGTIEEVDDKVSLYVHNGTPYVAVSGGNRPVVLEYSEADGRFNWVGVDTLVWGETSSLSLKGDDYGNLYLSYVYEGTAMVKKLSRDGDGWGTSWGQVGGAAVSDDAADVSLFVYNDMPYVAFTDISEDGKCVVKTLVNNSWLPVGGGDGYVSEDTAAGNSLYIDEGILYVAYEAGNSHNARVYKWEKGGSWVMVGTGGYASSGQTSHLSLAVYGGVPYLAYGDHQDGDAAVVMWYAPPAPSSSVWETVGNGPVSSPYSSFTSLYINDGIPYIAFSEDDRVAVERFVGNRWEVVGASQYSSSDFVTNASLYIDDNDTPYLAYIDYNAKVKVLKLTDFGDVIDWQAVGSTSSLNDSAYGLSVYAHNGVSYVAYADTASHWNPVVKMFTDGSTVPAAVGNLEQEYGEISASYMSMKGDAVGDLYLVFQAWVDSESRSRIIVLEKPYSSNEWSRVGDFASPGDATCPSLYLYDDGSGNVTPYVAYTDMQGGDGRATVRKFVDDAWVTVGNGNVSEDSSWETSLYVDDNGTPYVAYVIGEGEFSRVYKLDGDSWVPVGGDGYASDGDSYGISLSVSDGIPYLSYIDCNNDNAAVVRRYVPPMAPVISAQPGDQTVIEGQTATFTVTAAGTAPLTYQWFKDGEEIDGADSSILRITGAQAADEGSYTCTISNDLGSVTTHAASLTVNAPGSLVLAPTPGDRHVSLTWNGIPGTSLYQVYQDTALIESVSDNVYDVTGLTNGTTYSFEVKALDENDVVIASSGTVTATPAAVIEPTISAQPGDLTVIEGQTATFEVTAAGTAPLTYQWFKDGEEIDGADSSILRITGAQAANAGSYTCTISNAGGSVTTHGASLTVNAPGSLVLTPTPGDRHVSLTWSDVPGASLYQVYKDTALIESVSNNVYDVTGLTNGTAYSFKVKALDGNNVIIASSGTVSATPYSSSGDDSSSDDNNPSGGGTSPSTGSNPSNSGADILVNGKTENAGILSTSTQGGRTVTTVAVDPEKLEQKLKAEGDHAVVTIPVNTASDAVIGELNGEMVKSMENKQAVIEVRTEKAAYTLPARQINISAISEQLGQNVALEDIKVQIEISSPAEGTVQVVEDSAQQGSFTLVVPPMDFTVRCTYQDKTVEISQFNNYVERTVAIPDGVDPNKITTGVVVDPDGTVRHMPTRITVIGGRYYAVINSLTNSTYTVVWHPLEFRDVVNHWAKEAVNDMGSRMVIDGTGNGMFEPDRDITRAEFAAIVVRGLGLKPGTGKNLFSDVSPAEWYSESIETASAYGLISGYGNGTFGPTDKITREQAMTIVARAMEITGLKQDPASGEADAVLASFGDSDKTASWARESASACVKADIISGKNGHLLAPKADITRAEVAAIVSRLLKKSNLIN